VFYENEGAKPADPAPRTAPAITVDSDSDDGRQPPPKEDEANGDDAFDSLFNEDKPLSERLQDGDKKKAGTLTQTRERKKDCSHS
jgi:hypothetical protein